METKILKRSITVNGRKTSVSLEDEFWDALNEIAARRRQSVGELVSLFVRQNRPANLSSAIRIFVVEHFRSGENRRVDA